jgi:hypothetical protein
VNLNELVMKADGDLDQRTGRVHEPVGDVDPAHVWLRDLCASILKTAGAAK